MRGGEGVSPGGLDRGITQGEKGWNPGSQRQRARLQIRQSPARSEPS